MFYHRLVIVMAAAALASPTIAPAQDTTRTQSDQRVRVTKESPSEMLASRRPARRIPRADSIAAADSVTRADSVARVETARRDSVERVAQVQRDSVVAMERARADSLARIETMRRDSIEAINKMRQDSVARADSVTREAQRQRDLALQDVANAGWYVGLATGAIVPAGDFKALGYNPGMNVTVPIGWHSRKNLLGVRLDLGYSRFQGKTFAGATNGGAAVVLSNRDPQVLLSTINMTARFPISPARSLALYAIGGGGLYHFRNFGGASALAGFLGNDVLTTNEASLKTTRTKIGAQIGGGLDLAVGKATLFVESRFVNVFADRNDSVQFNDFFGANRANGLRWVPIIVGVTFR